MHREFCAHSSQSSPVREKQNDQQIIPNSSLAADGFDVWWRKTFAQHTAMAAEASALMLAHRRVGSASETRIEPTH